MTLDQPQNRARSWVFGCSRRRESHPEKASCLGRVYPAGRGREGRAAELKVSGWSCPVRKAPKTGLRKQRPASSGPLSASRESWCAHHPHPPKSCPQVEKGGRVQVPG